MKKLLLSLAMAVLCASPAFAAKDSTELKMATTTSTADTGLLDYLTPIFKADTGYDLKYVSVGTGAAIKHGENGDVDILLVHAKKSEEKFVADGFGVERFEVMYNDFIVVGPKDTLPYSNDVKATLTQVFEKKVNWVSRGDDSGTDKKEKGIWKSLNINPAENPNYKESGSGMGASLSMADELRALILSDRGTFLKMKNDASVKLDLDIICEKAPDLLNQYGVIAVNPAKYPDTNIKAANAFIEWITSDKVQKLIADFGVDKYGQGLFVPNAKKK